MGRSIESYGRKSLEQKRREEQEWYGSRPLDYVDESDFEKDGIYSHSQFQNDEEELNDTYSALFTKEELEEIGIKNMQKMIDESMQREPGEELYDAKVLGKATIGLPIQDTLDAAVQDENMEAQYKEFIEIAEEYDAPNPELEKRLAELVAALEGVF